MGQEVLELNRRYLALDARLKARAESGGRPNQLAAVDFLLSQRNLGKIAGIRGTVEELAEFDPRYKVALQVAGGNRFQALVVESDQVAEDCIKLLREEKRGRATFLPLNKMLPGRPHGKSLVAAKGPGASGFAIDLVKFDALLQPAFWYVFGETVVMDDLTHARSQMGGVRLVTLAGDLIEATGAISGGYLDPTHQGRGADSAVELKRLGEELREKSGAENAARTELGKTEERIRALAEELSKRSIEDRALQSTLEVVAKDLTAARERLRQTRDRLKSAAGEQTSAESSLATAEENLTRLTDELTELKSRIQKAQEQYLSLLPETISQRLRTLQESSESTANERVRVNGELESVRASLEALAANLAERRATLEKTEKEAAAKKKEIAQTERQARAAREALDALKSVESQQTEAAKGLAEKKRRLDADRLEVTGKLGQVVAHLETRRSMLTQEETRLAQAEAHFHELEEALKQFPEPEPNEKPISIEELKKKIAALDAELASLGDVNQRAVEEYDAEKTRLDEFDMSLDGLNAEYVGRMLRRNAERAQFVVISLRKVTLKFAQHLFGVTMRGDGCSRVVGIHLDDIHDVEARENARTPEELAAPLTEAR